MQKSPLLLKLSVVYTTQSNLQRKGDFYGKGYDRRQARKTDSGICYPSFNGKFIPAVLQSGGYCDRWKVSGRGSAGGGRLHRIDQLFDYRVLYGNLQRFCDSDCAEVWSKGRERNAPLCSQQCMGICDLCGGAHDRDGASVQKYPAVDADTGKYHRRCMDVYRHHFCGNSGDNSLQSDFSDYPCDGRFQNTGLFSGDVGTVKYCTRSVLHSGTENGCCGRSAGNRDFSGNFRYLLSGLYDPQI